MIFGLTSDLTMIIVKSMTSAPARFERVMGKVLLGLYWKTALLYMGDVIVFNSEGLAGVLDCLRSAGLNMECLLIQRK